jgi:hypothetical protein
MYAFTGRDHLDMTKSRHMVGKKTQRCSHCNLSIIFSSLKIVEHYKVRDTRTTDHYSDFGATDIFEAYDSSSPNSSTLVKYLGKRECTTFQRMTFPGVSTKSLSSCRSTLAPCVFHARLFIPLICPLSSTTTTLLVN